MPTLAFLVPGPARPRSGLRVKGRDAAQPPARQTPERLLDGRVLPASCGLRVWWHLHAGNALSPEKNSTDTIIRALNDSPWPPPPDGAGGTSTLHEGDRTLVREIWPLV